MPDSPIITSIHLLPEKASWDSLQHRPRDIISIGLRLDTGHTFWGDCTDPIDYSIPDQPAIFRADDLLVTLKNTVIPVLRGRKINDVQAFSELVGQLSETVTVTREVVQPRDDKKNVSRKEFLTGWLKTEETPPEKHYIKETIQRPIHPSIRYAVCWAVSPFDAV